MNTFKIVTITHKTANINHIGKYIPSANADDKELAATLKKIKADLEIDELLYLATCNRLTFLFITHKNVAEKSFLLNLFQILHPNTPQERLSNVIDIIETYSGEEAIAHLFSVASSLDSLVIGEREILRQLRGAYDFCRKNKLSGDNIRIAMKMAIPTAKEVYTHTKIGENSVSVVSLAMQEMLRHDLPENARFLIIGAGQTNNLVAKFLLKQEFKHFTIFNRSRENAELLAEKLNGKAYPLADLATYNKPFDVIITCTGASEPIITKELYTKLIGDDKSIKVIIDLAVPNDIDHSIVNNFNIDYIEVERLRNLAAQNLELRKKEATKATQIINKNIKQFQLISRQRRVERALSDIPHRVKAIKDRAINGVFQKEIAQMDAHSKATLERVMTYMEKKYIGIPISAAKDALENEMKPMTGV